MITEFLEVANKPVSDELTDDLGLYAGGLELDSLHAAELSAQLEDEFGSDPFSAALAGGGEMSETVVTSSRSTWDREDGESSSRCSLAALDPVAGRTDVDHRERDSMPESPGASSEPSGSVDLSMRAQPLSRRVRPGVVAGEVFHSATVLSVDRRGSGCRRHRPANPVPVRGRGRPYRSRVAVGRPVGVEGVHPFDPFPPPRSWCTQHPGSARPGSRSHRRCRSRA